MLFVSGDRLEGSFRDAFSNGTIFYKNGDKFEGKKKKMVLSFFYQ